MITSTSSCRRSHCGVATADTLLLQPVLSRTSYWVAWISRLGCHSPSISVFVFLFFFSQVVPSPMSVFRFVSWSLRFTCPTHLSLAFLHISVMYVLCLQSLALCPCIYTFSSLSLPVCSHGNRHCFHPVHVVYIYIAG